MLMSIVSEQTHQATLCQVQHPQCFHHLQRGLLLMAVSQQAVYNNISVAATMALILLNTLVGATP
eukprot:12264310-Ditylum_brightwellii.AAC.1